MINYISADGTTFEDLPVPGAPTVERLGQAVIVRAISVQRMPDGSMAVLAYEEGGRVCKVYLNGRYRHQWPAWLVAMDIESGPREPDPPAALVTADAGVPEGPAAGPPLPAGGAACGVLRRSGT